ncbi:hypothetical protein Ddc_17830 [Ditylenchus destructor]|nr:hypothetical protein Ddc_17830 [Ditylenchus destructor]
MVLPRRTAFCGMSSQKAALVFGIISVIMAISGCVTMIFATYVGYRYEIASYVCAAVVVISAIPAIVAYFLSSEHAGFNVSLLYLIALIVHGICVLYQLVIVIFIIIGWIKTESDCDRLAKLPILPEQIRAFCSRLTVEFTFALLLGLASLILYGVFEWSLWLAYLNQKYQEDRGTPNQNPGVTVVTHNRDLAAIPPPVASLAAPTTVVV